MPVCVAAMEEPLLQFVLVFTWLHSSGFNLGFATVNESIGQVVADLWQIKGKISGCFKNCTSIGLKQCQNKVSFQRNCSRVVLKFSLIL